MFDKIKENYHSVTDNAQDMKNQAKQSSQDWLDYVIDHPLQCLLFGAVIGLAVKGLCKK